ncbi:MAG: hypothetical protein H0V34_03940 [Gammaproteobacteria bacterium]|nr:hypothetical protein [Gammaproteobacteria bacterium]
MAEAFDIGVGSDNLLSRNIASDNVDDGFDSSGESNTFTANAAPTTVTVSWPEATMR